MRLTVMLTARGGTGKGRMEFLEKLLARPQRAIPLKAGSLSLLAADARSEQWIDQCAVGMGTQEARFAISLLMRALRAADIILTKIEAEQTLLAHFEGASRDVLLYEVLHFCLHRISDELRRILAPDIFGAKIYLSDLTFQAVGELARQHLGRFDVSRHRLKRARDYLSCAGNPKEMAERLIGILLCAQGGMGMDQREVQLAKDADIEVHICLRGVVHAAAAACIFDGAEKLAARYDEELRPQLPE